VPVPVGRPSRGWSKHDSVRRLNETLKGEANLDTDEGQLHLTIRRIGSLGGLDVTGIAVDTAGTGNRLAFKLAQYDQTQMLKLPGELEAVIAAL
jgi:hypothetical protein